MIGWSGNLGRISESEKVSFQMVTERNMLFDDLTSSESKFQRVGTATEKAWVPTPVLTLETDNKWKSGERSSLGYPLLNIKHTTNNMLQ